MSDSKKVQDALAKLDPKNDAHWTTAGQPNLNILKIFYGGPITREEVDQAAPDYNREFATSAADTGAKKDEGTSQTTDNQSQTNVANDAAPGGATPAQQANAEAQATEGPAPSQVVTQPGAEGKLGDQAVDPNQLHIKERADGLKTLVAPGVATPNGAAPSQEALDHAERTLSGEGEQNLREDLSAQIESLEQQLESINEDADLVARRKAEINLQLDALRAQTATKGVNGFADANAEYLAAQARNRQAKADQMGRVRDAGITRKMLDDVIPKAAPVDQALRNRPRQQG